ncbi:hypothetical protein GOODEAATRI_022219 [Goodea atripinnis]|uniref:Uncharacterized protein n=1 Tax=Goodea atripinnis TaxID=208336 RepID=A0ABV0NMC9_9TELE
MDPTPVYRGWRSKVKLVPAVYSWWRNWILPRVSCCRQSPYLKRNIQQNPTPSTLLSHPLRHTLLPVNQLQAAGLLHVLFTWIQTCFSCIQQQGEEIKSLCVCGGVWSESTWV